MKLEEWVRLQEVFGALFGASPDARMGLFIENNQAREGDVILIPAHRADVIEALSPGGWQDCPDARERRWGLLVGLASAHGDHGLQSGVERDQ
ncbi:MAG: hypothetical protein ACK554_04785 [Erythrobacteraceae bacterium]|jgi:hypothetical protein